MTADKHKATGYDKYIDWRLFVFPVLMLAPLLVMPASKGMRDVGTEYAVGEKAVRGYLAEKMFHKPTSDLQQCELLTVRMMEKSLRMGALSREGLVSRGMK